MNHTPNDAKSSALLQAQIQCAFPESTYTGQITSVDGLTDEWLDEEQALYSELRGKKWSEISAPFIRNNPDGFLHLTDEAFVAFIGAWLSCALNDAHVREFTVYSFSPNAHESVGFIRDRIRLLNPLQRKALEAFFAYCVEVESSLFIKQYAQSAFEYIASFSGE